MPQKIETTVYTFDELNERAKETARDWMRECASEFFSDDAEMLYDDFQACAACLGIAFSSHSVKLMNGTTRQAPDIFWSGFSSQGDGASFAGSYSYVKGAPKAIRAHAPQDKELMRIADELQALQRTHAYRITAGIHQGRGNYSHAYSMKIDTEYCDYATAEAVSECLRDFANWMYRQLEAEYDYRLSNESIDDGIRANEYTFTDDGKRFG